MLGGDLRSRVCDSCSPTVTSELKWIVQRQSAAHAAVNLRSPHSLRYGLAASPFGLMFSIPPSVAAHVGVLLHVAGARTPLQVLAQQGELATLASPHGGTAEGRSHITQHLLPGGALVRPLAPASCPPQHSDPRPGNKAEAVALLALQQQARTHLVTLLVRWISSIPGLAHSEHATHWVVTLASLATRIAWGLGPNANAGDGLDLDAYHRVKAIPGGSPTTVAASVQVALSARLGDALARTGIVVAPASSGSAAPAGAKAVQTHSLQLPTTAATTPLQSIPIVLTPMDRLQAVMAAAWRGWRKPSPAPPTSKSGPQPDAGSVTAGGDAWWVGQCSITQGVVIRGNVAHKNMAREIKAPRVLLLQGGLGLENLTQGRSQLLFTTNLHAQGSKYVKLCVAKLLEHNPSLVLCTGEVSQDALAEFLAAGVTVIPSVNTNAMKRISRSTGATILRSVHAAPSLPSDIVVGSCSAFRVVHMSVASSTAAEATAAASIPGPALVQPERNSSPEPHQRAAARREISYSRKKQGGVEMVSYLVLEGCRADLMCSTLLRGGVLGVLVGKVLLRNAVQAAYAMRCESSVLFHVGATPPSWSLPPLELATDALKAQPLPHGSSAQTVSATSSTACSAAAMKALQGVFGRSLLRVPAQGGTEVEQRRADASAVQHWMALCAVTPAAAWWLQPTYTPATRIPVFDRSGGYFSQVGDAPPLFGGPSHQEGGGALHQDMGSESGSGADHAAQMTDMSVSASLKALRRWCKSPRLSDGSRSIALPAALSLLGGSQPDWEEAAHTVDTSPCTPTLPASRDFGEAAGPAVPARSGTAPPRGVALRAWHLLPHSVTCALVHILHVSSATDGLTIAQQLVGLHDHATLTNLEFRAIPFNSPFDTTLRQFLETSWFDARAQVRGRWFRNVRMDLIHGHARVEITVQPDPEAPTGANESVSGLQDDTAVSVSTSVRGAVSSVVSPTQQSSDGASLDWSMRAGVTGDDSCQMQAQGLTMASGSLSSAAASTSFGRVLQLILYGRAYRSSATPPVDAASIWAPLLADSPQAGAWHVDPAAPCTPQHAPLLHDDIHFVARKRRVRFSRKPIIPHAVLLRVGFGADRAWQQSHVAALLADLLGAASNRASMQEQTIEALAHSLDVFPAFSLARKVARALQKHEQAGTATPDASSLAAECGVAAQDAASASQVERFAQALADLNADSLLFPSSDDEAGVWGAVAAQSSLQRAVEELSEGEEQGAMTPVKSLSREPSISSRKPSLEHAAEGMSPQAEHRAEENTLPSLPLSSQVSAETKPSSASNAPMDQIPVLSTTITAALLARLSLQAAAVHHEIAEAVHAMHPAVEGPVVLHESPGPQASAAASTEENHTPAGGSVVGQSVSSAVEDTLEPMSLVYSWNWVTRDLERLIVGCGRILIVPDVNFANNMTLSTAAIQVSLPVVLGDSAHDEEGGGAAQTQGGAAETGLPTETVSGQQSNGGSVRAMTPPSSRPAAVSTVYATMAGSSGVALGKSHGRAEGSTKRGSLPLAWLQAAAADPADALSQPVGGVAAAETGASSALTAEPAKPRTHSEEGHTPGDGAAEHESRSSRSRTLTDTAGSQHAKALLQSASAVAAGTQASPGATAASADGPVHRRRQVTQMSSSAAKALGQHVRIHADGTAVHVDSLPASTRTGQRGFFRRGAQGDEGGAGGLGDDATRATADTSFSRRIDVQFTNPSHTSVWLRHPDFPTGRFGTVVNVDPQLPGSIIAYTLCSDPYLQKLEAALGDVAVERGLTEQLLEHDAPQDTADGHSPSRTASPGTSPGQAAGHVGQAQLQRSKDTNSVDLMRQEQRLMPTAAVLHRTTASSPRRAPHLAGAYTQFEGNLGMEHPGYTQTVSSMADLMRLEAAAVAKSLVLEKSSSLVSHSQSPALDVTQEHVNLTLALPPDTLRKLNSGRIGEAMHPGKSLRGHAVHAHKPSVSTLWSRSQHGVASRHAVAASGAGRRPRGGTEGAQLLHPPLSTAVPARGVAGKAQRPLSIGVTNRQQLHRTSSAYASNTSGGTGPHPHAWLGAGSTPRARVGSEGISAVQQATEQRSTKLQSLFARTVDVDDGVGALMDEAEAAAQAAAGVNRSGSSTPNASGMRRLGSRSSLSQMSDDGMPPLAAFPERKDADSLRSHHKASRSAGPRSMLTSPSEPGTAADPVLSRRRSRYAAATLGGTRSSAAGPGSGGKPLLSKGSFWAAARRSSSALIPTNASRPRQRTLGSVVVTAMEHSSVSAVSITMNGLDGRGSGSPALSPVPQELPEDLDDITPVPSAEEMTPKVRSRAAISRSLDRRSGRRPLSPAALDGPASLRHNAPSSPTKRNMSEQHMQQALKSAQEHLAVDAERMDTIDDYGSAHTVGSEEHPMGESPPDGGDDDVDADTAEAAQWIQEREVGAFGVPLSTQPPAAVANEPSMAGTPTALDVLQSPVHVNVMTRFVDTGNSTLQNAKELSATYTINSYWVSQFHALREVYLGSQRAFVESLANSSKWDTSGGKSKARFWRTSDQRFVLKSVSKTEFAMFVDAASGYFCHMAQALQSMHERARRVRSTAGGAKEAKSATFKAAAALGRGNVFDMHAGNSSSAALAATTPTQIAKASAASGGALFWPWAMNDDQVSKLTKERMSHQGAQGKLRGSVPTSWRIAAAGHPGSLLVKVFGVFRIEVVDDVTKTKYLRYFLVMENLWHGVHVHRNMRFDIKGKTRAQAASKDDDATSKQHEGDKIASGAAALTVSAKSKVLLDDDFFAFTGGGPLLLPAEAHQAISDALSNDTQYLAESNIVDYSLLVGVDPERHIIVVGIIDYLRQFDLVKQVEMNIKMAASYATNAEVTIQPPRKYQERLMAAAGRCFASSPALRGHNMLPLLPAWTQAAEGVEEEGMQSTSN